MTPVRLGDFELVAPIGRGGMGAVFAARHAPTGARAAVKRVSEGDDADRAALIDEIRAVAALDHPSVVRVYDQGLDADGAPWFAMALADRALDRGDVDGAALIRRLDDALSGLAHAHARGVLHLDLKPTNLLDVGGRAVLADFGVARRIGARDGRIRGTPRFMAPEHREGRWRDVGPWTDLYALGRTVCAWLGWPDDVPADALVAPTVPDGFGALLATWLADHPDDRPASAGAALAALRALPSPSWAGVVRVAAPVADATLATAEAPAVRATPTRRRAAPPPPPVVGAVPEDPPRPPDDVAVGLGLFGFRDPALVGRRAERAALWEALAGVAQTGRARFVALRGASGSGKSRLLRWLVETAAESGVARGTVLRHDAGGGGDDLRAELARELGVDGLERTDAIERLSQRFGPERARTLAALLHAVSATPDETALATRWVAESDPRPWILGLDDAQWAGRAWDVALRLLQRSEGAPVLLVATLRSDAPGDGPAAEAATDASKTADAAAIDVGPLPDTDVERLLEEVLHLDPELSDRLVVRAGGNALYSVQLAGHWARRGWLAPGPRGLVLTEAAPPLPDDLRDAWRGQVTAALAAFDEPSRRAVEAAAALGREVPDGPWRELGGTDATRDHLVAARLAARTSTGWRFAHDAVRDVVFEGCSDPTTTLRRSIDALRRHGAPPDRLAPLWFAVGDADRAADAWLDAALRAVAGVSLRMLPELLSGAERALDAFGEAQGARRARVDTLRAHLAALRGRPDEAETRARAVLATDPPPTTAGYALRVLATIALHRGQRDTALDLYLQARERYVEAAEPERVSLCEVDAGGVLLGLRRLDEAEVMLRPTLTAFDPTTYPTLLASAHVAYSRLLLFRKDVAGARDVTAAAVAALDGRPSAVLSIALDDVGLHELLADRLDAAEGAIRASLRMMEDLGFYAVASPRLKLAWLSLRRGDVDRADAELRATEPGVVALKSPAFEAAALSMRAAVEAARGDAGAVAATLPRLTELRAAIQGTDELVAALLDTAAERSTDAANRAALADLAARFRPGGAAG